MDDNTQEIIRRQTRAITTMFVIILLLLLIIFLLVFCKRNKPGVCGVKDPVPFCGTQAMEEGNSAIRRNLAGFEGDYQRGRKLFKQNCAVCHTTDHKLLTGPGLGGLFNRLPKPAEPWLRRYILNNKKVKASGDPYSLMLGEKYQHAEMVVFEGQLSEKEIDEIIYYLAGY